MKMKKKLRNSVALGVVLLSMVACTGKTSTSESACGNNGQCSEQCKNECNQNNCKNKKEMTYSKKYTNADFYKDGKFQQEVAMHRSLSKQHSSRYRRDNVVWNYLSS